MIKEFDLDAPELPKLSRSEFRYQTRSVSNLFERLLKGKIAIGKAWKIMVEVVPAIEYPAVRNLLGVLVVQVVGEAESLLDEGDLIEKQSLALSWLVTGASGLAPEAGTEPATFEAAAEHARALEFRNIEEWLKPRSSPNRKRKATVVVERTPLEARIIGRIMTSDGDVISERPLFSERPDEFLFAPMIGSLVWIDKDVVELRSKNGLQHWYFAAGSDNPLL